MAPSAIARSESSRARPKGTMLLGAQFLLGPLLLSSDDLVLLALQFQGGANALGPGLHPQIHDATSRAAISARIDFKVRAELASSSCRVRTISSVTSGTLNQMSQGSAL
jgi:hypothetical protein